MREAANEQLREIATEKLRAAAHWAEEKERAQAANRAVARQRAERAQAEMDRARKKAEASALATGSAAVEEATRGATIASDWDQRSRDRLSRLRSENDELVKTMSSFLAAGASGEVGKGGDA